MTIEMANKLLELRKQSGMSQEELAQKLGISRQSISKWERAESSPDIDNLIALAQIYNVSLDALLLGKKLSINQEDNADEPTEDKSADMGREFVHVNDEDSIVKIGSKGIYVKDKNENKEINISKKGVYVNGENNKHLFVKDNDGKKNKYHELTVMRAIPFPVVTVILYVIFGFADVCGGWSWGWMVFLTIPLYYTLIDAIEMHKPECFCYPVLTVILFLMWGQGEWFNMGYNVSWIVFLTIPLYYSICSAFKLNKKSKKE